jgi:hypothetical protein
MTVMSGRDASTSAEGSGRERGRSAGVGGAVIVFASTRAAILAGLAVACQVLVFPPAALAWLAWLAPLPVFLLFPMRSAAAAATG